MNKKLYYLCCFIMLISIVGTTIFIALMPDIVPMHYNLQGEINRMGSKYENLIFPLATIGLGVFFLLFARYYGKKSQAKDEKSLLYVAFVTLIFITALGFYYMLQSVNYGLEAPSSNSVGIDFVGVGIGLLLICFGFIMPKVPRNSTFGLRTKWSMANDRVWQKCQRFGGLSSIVFGVVLILLSLVLSSDIIGIALIVMVVLLLFICIIASYYYYKNDISE